jgi:hypothetical protein
MQKYVIIFVFDNPTGQYNPYSPLPGQMFEYARCESLEQAQDEAKKFNASGGHLLILPFYEVEQAEQLPPQSSQKLIDNTL